MTDAEGKPLKAGDVVICVDPPSSGAYEDYFKLNNLYVIQSDATKANNIIYCIIDNKGKIYPHRFKLAPVELQNLTADEIKLMNEALEI